MELFNTIYLDLQRCASQASMDAVWSVSSVTLSFVAHVAVGVACYVASLATGNDSHVDRLWSVAPVASAWIHALWAAPLSWGPRHTYAALVTMWGMRLSYNFFRRGGYSASFEDYRWEHVRKMKAFQIFGVWQLFRLTFVSLYQMLLLWAIALPIAMCPRTYNTYSCTIDTFCGTAFFCFLLMETVADQQQWNFQNKKRSVDPKIQSDVPLDIQNGFLTRGLWQYSRHPNVFAEQSMWCVIYIASAWHMGRFFHPVCAGALLLIQLTFSSSRLTEELSLNKYPSYRAYQDSVSMLIPMSLLSRAALDAALKKKSK